MDNKPLAHFCLLLEVLLFFLAKTLAEALGLTDKFKNMPLARKPV